MAKARYDDVCVIVDVVDHRVSDAENRRGLYTAVVVGLVEILNTLKNLQDNP